VEAMAFVVSPSTVGYHKKSVPEGEKEEEERVSGV